MRCDERRAAHGRYDQSAVRRLSATPLKGTDMKMRDIDEWTISLFGQERSTYGQTRLQAGLGDVPLSENAPSWCAVDCRAVQHSTQSGS